VGVYLNGLLGQWWDWGSNPPAFAMHDDGLNGDEVADDDIWTIGIALTAGQAKVQSYKYGINSLDNEAGFAQNRSVTLDDASSTFYAPIDCFGEQNSDERLPFPEYGCGSAIDDEIAILPQSFMLYQNYPNPFNPTTTIVFEMPYAETVRLEIYNVLGQKVQTLHSGKLEAGYHLFEWNARGQHGQELSTGIYIYRLTAGNHSFQKKMVFMK